ncbi:hypothetical protein [Variovorax terrae]|uniref:Lipoprotein n=1 Tax=Variovorax terrae TaxID=2923278 RepID=A0A9X1W5C8_9BURK|nr:hypothetical protein [Variovorax terrae]MCJ0766028.1 hypothetical protein [Variovorax terrae]
MVKTTTTAVAVAALLAACGGGGGGGGGGSAPTPGVLATANYQEVSTAGAAAVSSSGALSSAISLASVPDAAPVAAPAEDAGSLLRRLVERYAQPGVIRDQPQATGSSTQGCAYGGSVRATATVANPNYLSAGDSISLLFTNCVEASGQPGLNGTLNISVVSPLVMSGSTIVGGELNTNSNGLIAGSMSLSGNVNMKFSGSQQTQTYQNYSVTRGGRTAVYNYAAVLSRATVPNTLTVNAGGSITVNNANYTLSTPTALTLGSSSPIGGLMRVSDSAGARADITPASSSTQFSVSFYPSGSSTATASYTATWASLQ